MNPSPDARPRLQRRALRLEYAANEARENLREAEETLGG
jgi:hypothetical protein